MNWFVSPWLKISVTNFYLCNPISRASCELHTQPIAGATNPVPLYLLHIGQKFKAQAQERNDILTHRDDKNINVDAELNVIRMKMHAL